MKLTEEVVITGSSVFVPSGGQPGAASEGQFEERLRDQANDRDQQKEEPAKSNLDGVRDLEINNLPPSDSGNKNTGTGGLF